MSYPKAPDDEQRVDFLRSLAILDTAPDENLDRIVELCRTIFEVKTSTISMVDEDRQWFKAVVGLDVCETNREDAFCNYTILDSKIFEVCDARNDPAFRDNGLVTGPPYIQYYAGAPLTYDGVRLGSLCLIHDEPCPPLTEREREVLKGLAEIAVYELHVSRMVREAVALMTGL